ncbi:MAG: cupredoxin domain-containing protein [Dehalococcoidia bacterium]|nr:cupredoxin domain-containing protein [Dehalococcoidia bacterium]
MELGDNYFDPTKLKAAPSETLTLKLENGGKATHTFTIDSLSIDKTLQPGEEAAVDISPSQAGALTYRCRFHGGSSNMKGTLTVGQGGPAGAGGSSTPKPAGGYSGGY